MADSLGAVWGRLFSVLCIHFHDSFSLSVSLFSDHALPTEVAWLMLPDCNPLRIWNLEIYTLYFPG